MNKKVLVVLGHPRKNSYCAAIADEYEKAAKDNGAEVRRINVGDLNFEILRDPEKQEDNPEPDIKKAQEDVKWADHMVFVYPTWWAIMPALCKSFFERVFTHGFAFAYKKDSPWWEKLLTGKSAHVFVTMDAPLLIYKLLFGAPGHKMVKHGILGFCGVKPIKISTFGPIRNSSDEQRKKWLEKAYDFGKKVV